MVREGVGTDVLRYLGEGLDGTVIGEAASEKEEAEAGVEAFVINHRIETGMATDAGDLLDGGFGIELKRRHGTPFRRSVPRRGR